MANYFFDFDDGVSVIKDKIGIELVGPEDIKSEAFDMLYDIVQSRMPVGYHSFAVRVRDEFGVFVYEGAMSIVGRRF